MHAELEKSLRRGRRRAIINPADFDNGAPLGRGDIEMLLPHRGSFLLLDTITCIDGRTDVAWGSRRLAPDDPVFSDHFPDHPVYPGVLLVEAMAQLALASRAYHLQGAAAATPHHVRFLRITEAAFVNPAGPGDEITLLQRAVEDTGYTFSALVQSLKGETVLAVAMVEAMEVDA